MPGMSEGQRYAAGSSPTPSPGVAPRWSGRAVILTALVIAVPVLLLLILSFAL